MGGKSLGRSASAPGEAAPGGRAGTHHPRRHPIRQAEMGLGHLGFESILQVFHRPGPGLKGKLLFVERHDDRLRR